MITHIVASSLLIAAIIGIRAAVRKKVSPRIVYGLWLIVLVKLCIPVSLWSVKLPETVKPIAGEHETEISVPDDLIPGYDTSENILPFPSVFEGETVFEETEEPSSLNSTLNEKEIRKFDLPSPKTLAISVWVIGAVSVFAWFAISGTVQSAILRDGRTYLGKQNGIRVYSSPNAKTPCVAGIVPAIYLTPEAVNSPEKEIILAHETAHIKQLDPVWNILRIVAVSVYWWNPLIWVCARLSVLDSELACDDHVSRGFTREERIAYGRTLLNFTPYASPFSMGLGSGSMKERLIMLTNKPKKHVVLTLIAVVLALIVGGCSLGGVGTETTTEATTNEGAKTEVTTTETPDNSVENYKYNAVDPVEIRGFILPNHFFIPLTGGTLAEITEWDYRMEYQPSSYSGMHSLAVLFDEDAKTLYPVCSKEGCDHKTEDCFSYQLCGKLVGSYVTVLKDKVYSVGYGGRGTDSVLACCYSLDGTLLNQSVFDMLTLIRADGETAKKPAITYEYVFANNKVYLDIYDSADRKSTAKSEYNRWILCYDIEADEYDVLVNYVVDYGQVTNVGIAEATDEYLVICNENYSDTKIDLKTGEYTSDHCFNRHESNGWIFDKTSIVYNGVTYHLEGERNNTNYYYSEDLGVNDIAVSKTFENGKYILFRIAMETEDGIIFTYYETDGERLEYYEVRENYETITYYKPLNRVYVTKEDYFDGQIDDPWYYDAETATFVQK